MTTSPTSPTSLCPVCRQLGDGTPRRVTEPPDVVESIYVCERGHLWIVRWAECA